jgi:ribosomal protein L11 methyltransferase
VSWQNLMFTVLGCDVDALSDALIDAGALSVDVSDADAGTDAERPAFAEPGSPSAPWARSAVSALFAAGIDARGALDRACQAAGIAYPLELAGHEVLDRDWVRLSQSQFKPICISPRLWIVPTWETAPDCAAINIVLDPGAAFGTGSHATTRLCLRWLEENIRGGESVLDYGCGSGILAIAAARLGAARVSGVDIDPQAVLAARANAMLNRISADFHEPGVNPQLPCDVVVANILAGPLIALAPLLASAMLAEGRIALSGVLVSQADEVLHAYAHWFEMAAPVADEDWVLLAGRRLKAMP